MLCLVAVLSFALLLHAVEGQMHSRTDIHSIHDPRGCSCQIRCCPDHRSPRRPPPYTNIPNAFSATCCGCMYCPSFNGPGPFFPIGWSMLTPLASIQMAMSMGHDAPDAPDAPDVPDVPDTPDAPEREGPETPDPPELEGPEIEGSEVDNTEA